eukprot:5847606-Lingulodinium_polyedra.AAC.1
MPPPGRCSPATPAGSGLPREAQRPSKAGAESASRHTPRASSSSCCPGSWPLVGVSPARLDA